MANGIHAAFNPRRDETKVEFVMPWDVDELAFVVREPFKSKHSNIEITAGMIHCNEKLAIESQMPSGGVIFSDGIQADYIQFNSGTKVEVGTAKQRALLLFS